VSLATSSDRSQLIDDILEIGISLTTERDLYALLARILGAARRFTRAEAGTVFIREGEALRFAVIQNDPLETRYGAHELHRLLQATPLSLSAPSLAGHAARTGELINVPDAYATGVQQPPAFDARVDGASGYSTRSVLVVPLQNQDRHVIGVLQLINALDDDGAIVPFAPEHEQPVRALASQAAIAIRMARLEDVSFRDALTDLYNRRYFALRLDEEAKRSARFGHPLSLVVFDLDEFKTLNDAKGHHAGDATLKAVARLLVRHSRSFMVITRREGDDFVVILANTPKAGAASYAERIRGILEGHEFAVGRVTASFGVASFPADASSADALVTAADRALSTAKLHGRNRVATC